MKRDYEKENKEYEKVLKKHTKNDAKETLLKSDHKLILEASGNDEILRIYDELGDIEVADLTDFFFMERRDGEGI